PEQSPLVAAWPPLPVQPTMSPSRTTSAGKTSFFTLRPRSNAIRLTHGTDLRLVPPLGEEVGENRDQPDDAGRNLERRHLWEYAAGGDHPRRRTRSTVTRPNTKPPTWAKKATPPPACGCVSE